MRIARKMRFWRVTDRSNFAINSSKLSLSVMASFAWLKSRRRLVPGGPSAADAAAAAATTATWAWEADAASWVLFPNELNGIAGDDNGFTGASGGEHGLLGCELQNWRFNLIAFFGLRDGHVFKRT